MICKVKVISTGSKGNAVLLNDEILIDCGVPFCQAGMTIAGMTSGCPLHNLVPEWNDLAYSGNWERAYNRLKKTNNFPEFTSRVCPALCEAACTCNLDSEPVSTKENERAIIDKDNLF